MKKTRIPLLLCCAGLCSAGCASGREAAWHDESATVLVAPPPKPTVEEEPDLDALAAAAWLARDDRAKLEEAIAHWDVLLTENPERGDLHLHLARAYFFLGDAYLRSPSDHRARIAAFEKGISAGERAMMASSEEFATKVREQQRVEDAVLSIPLSGQAAIYWYASNLGKFSVAKGFTTTLFYKDRIHAVMQRVLSLDETFFHAAPHRYFGAFYAKAPAFAGGDLEASKKHFDRALELDSDYLGTKVLYAEYYAVKKVDRALFVQLLEEVLQADPAVLSDLLPEQKVEQAKARELLSAVDDFF